MDRWAEAGPGVIFARQSLPLIVNEGRLNPELDDSTKWGFTLGNAVRVWRTGIGIDRRGNLIYAAADYQTVTTLAEILRRAGAVSAMQLDINPEWPTLITYRHDRGLQPDQGGAELPAAPDPVPRPRRPRLLRRLYAAPRPSDCAVPLEAGRSSSTIERDGEIWLLDEHGHMHDLCPACSSHCR